MKVRDAKEIFDLLEKSKNALVSLDGMQVGRVNFNDHYSGFNKKIWEVQDNLARMYEIVERQ